MRCRCVEGDRQRRIARLRNSRKDRDRWFIRTADIAHSCICPGYTGRLDCFQESRAYSSKEEGIAANTPQLRTGLAPIPVEGDAGCTGGRRKMDGTRDVEFKGDCSIRNLRRRDLWA